MVSYQIHNIIFFGSLNLFIFWFNLFIIIIYHGIYVVIDRLLLFFVMCKAKGALDYQRSMYCYELMLRYWENKKLPIIELLRLNHTMFSEESGEIALSALTTSQPLSTRADIEQTRQHWQIVKLKYESLHADQQLPHQKRYRFLSKFSL